MKSRYTRGPWRIKESHKAGGVVHLAIIAPDGISMPASITPMAWRRDEDDANAALISAAPELLEALEKVVAIADRSTVEFDAARAAIKKAKGE